MKKTLVLILATFFCFGALSGCINNSNKLANVETGTFYTLEEAKEANLVILDETYEIINLVNKNIVLKEDDTFNKNKSAILKTAVRDVQDKTPTATAKDFSLKYYGTYNNLIAVMVNSTYDYQTNGAVRIYQPAGWKAQENIFKVVKSNLATYLVVDFDKNPNVELDVRIKAFYPSGLKNYYRTINAQTLNEGIYCHGIKYGFIEVLIKDNGKVIGYAVLASLYVAKGQHQQTKLVEYKIIEANSLQAYTIKIEMNKIEMKYRKQLTWGVVE